MSTEQPSVDPPTSHVRSGPEIVADFVASLKEDLTLDAGTVIVIEELLTKGKLTFTNLLKSLEEIRGKSSI
jgi:hypothetical protein